MSLETSNILSETPCIFLFKLLLGTFISLTLVVVRIGAHGYAGGHELQLFWIRVISESVLV